MTVWVFKPISKTAIYTDKDDKFLINKGKIDQAYNTTYNPLTDAGSLPAPTQEPFDPPAEVPDMAEAERIWKALVDAAQG